MSLIEHLDQDHGEAFLRRTFEYVLDVLEHDRYRQLGSGGDDLRAWLVRGGMPRVRQALDAQMERRRFTPEQQAAVRRTLADLEESHRDALQRLTAAGIIGTLPPDP